MAERLGIADGQGRDAHRLLQVGGLLFLLGLLVGFAVPRMTVPRLGLSTHLLGITQGTLLLVVGLVWPRLSLSQSASRVGHGLAIYGCLAPWTANLLGAVWGAGNSMLPLAAGAARGSPFQEGTIRVLLVSGALCLVSTAILVLWGLRTSRRIAPGR
jgi:(hydroxyamino)benzene mutase